jgi:hypothetical protein
MMGIPEQSGRVAALQLALLSLQLEHHSFAKTRAYLVEQAAVYTAMAADQGSPRGAQRFDIAAAGLNMQANGLASRMASLQVRIDAVQAELERMGCEEFHSAKAQIARIQKGQAAFDVATAHAAVDETMKAAA